MSIFIVYNLLLNSEIVPQWIQQKISRKVTETDSQKLLLEFENCKQQLFKLTMRLPACLWAQIARTPFNYTITARTLLAKCDDYQFQRLILQFPAFGKKSSYRKNVHHNLSIKYASRCWVKRKWRNVLWDKPFPGVQTNLVESWKHSTEKYHDQTIKFTPCSRTNSILLLSLFASHICSP